jgi:dihydrofolate reductase
MRLYSKSSRIFIAPGKLSGSTIGKQTVNDERLLISLIVAMDEQGGIGRAGGLPWRLRDDLKQFKALTWGHYLILGRKTYESIGRPLPGRKMVVLTRNLEYRPVGCQVVHSLSAALALVCSSGAGQVFIGGGGDIFAQALPLAGRLDLTWVHARADCDVFFPAYDPLDWREVERVFHPADADNQYAFTYRLLLRNSPDCP